jgi:hypothetical protein
MLIKIVSARDVMTCCGADSLQVAHFQATEPFLRSQSALGGKKKIGGGSEICMIGSILILKLWKFLEKTNCRV